MIVISCGSDYARVGSPSRTARRGDMVRVPGIPRIYQFGWTGTDSGESEGRGAYSAGARSGIHIAPPRFRPEFHLCPLFRDRTH